MPFNGIGVYTPVTSPDFPAVAGTTIRAAQFNNNISDIASALTNCITRDGQSQAVANISLGGFKLIAVAEGTSSTDAVNIGQLASTAVGKGAALIGNAAQIVASISALRGIPVTSTRDVFVQGYAAASDGGHGHYYGVTGASIGTYVDNGGSVIVPTGGDGSSAWLLRTGEIFNVRQFGAVVADCSAAIATSLGVGSSFLPRGTFVTKLSGSTMFTGAGPAKLSGDFGTSILELQEQLATGISTWFAPADDFTLSNFSLTYTKALAGVSFCNTLDTRANNISLQNLKFAGNTVLSAGAADRDMRIVKAHSTLSTSNLDMINLNVDSINYAFLKGNADTSVQTSIKVTGGRYTNPWRTVFAFNSPSAYIEDVIVSGVTFKNHAGVSNGDSAAVNGLNNAVGLVNIRGGRVIGNHISGIFGAVAHIEENSNGIAVIGNTVQGANPGSNDAAFETVANNVGTGTTITPQNVVHVANVAVSTDGVGNGFGIQSGAAGGDGVAWALYTGNVSDGYAAGIKASVTNQRSVLIANNVLKGATSGIDIQRASLLIRGNVVKDCATPLKTARGGLMGSVHYVNLASPNAAMTAFGSATNGPMILTEWSWETDTFSTVNGVQYFDIGPMPTRIFGRFSIVITSVATVHRLAELEITYDGATFTNTSKLSYGSGTITINGVANNAGSLAIQVTDSADSGSSGVRLQVLFRGGVFVV